MQDSFGSEESAHDIRKFLKTAERADSLGLEIILTRSSRLMSVFGL